MLENSEEHIYLTGKAGTGKSTLLQYFRKHSKKNIVVLAPTGIAAINVKGMTIHSFFYLPPKIIESFDIVVKHKRKRIIEKLDTLIIDEISMVRADVFDAIDYALRKYRKNDQPFGGVQIVLIGDLYQLPPVIVGEEMKSYFQFEYGGPYFFMAHVLGRIKLLKKELTHIFRQKDPDFVHLLNAIRDGDSGVHTLEKLNECCDPFFKPIDTTACITLSSTNAIANRINTLRLFEIKSQEYKYTAKKEGKFERWKSGFPNDEILSFKKGAQIMMVRNDMNRRWVNGSIGVITSLSQNYIEVLIDEEIYEVEPSEWELIEYNYDPKKNKVEENVVGKFTQYPLKLAWAITIHKSQGKTFEQVYIDLGRGAFAHGQLYVALSRCTTFEGVHLKHKVKPDDLIIDERVLDF